MNNIARTKTGMFAIFVVILVGVLVFNKAEVGTRLKGLVSSTETVRAEFAQNYKVVAYESGSDVKVAGVVVGTITGISQTDRGTFVTTMQVDRGIREKLGSDPTATIRATLLLGGRYFIDLAPGGKQGVLAREMIPLQRTSIPTELYDVMDAAGGTAAAIQGIRSSIVQTDKLLASGGTEALDQLVKDAPATLQPAKDVVAGLRGTQPETDWANAVQGLRNTAVAMTSHEGQTEAMITSVARTTAALAAGAKPLSSTAEELPDTLRATRKGMDDLRPTLDQLVVTANDFRSSAKALSKTLRELDPALSEARPVLAEMKPTVDDAKPLVDRLIPVTRRATDVFNDLAGPPLDQINGPIMKTLYAPWSGKGPYLGGGASGNPLYKELAFLASNSASIWGWHDLRSAYTRLAAGGGPHTVGGLFDPLPQDLAKRGLVTPGSSAFRGDPGVLGDPQDHTQYQRPPVTLFPPSVPKNENPLLAPLDKTGGK